MSKTVVRLDNIVGALPINVKYFSSGTTTAAIENGRVVALNGLIAGEYEILAAIPIADVDAAGAKLSTGKIAIIASPEYMVDSTKINLDEYENPAGLPARAYIPVVGNIISFTAEAFNAVPTTTNKYVTLYADGDTKMTGVSSAVNNQIGEFIGSDVVGSKTFYAVRICE